MIAVGVMVALVLAGIGGYAVAGFSLASNRISRADSALEAAMSHEDRLDATFSAFRDAFALFSLDQPDAVAFRAQTDKLVTGWEANRTQVRGDDSRLASAGRSLTDQQWLTAFSRSSLDAEAGRVSHARKAMAAAATIAGDYLQDGQFLQALAAVLTDLTAITISENLRDFVGATGTIPTLKQDIGKALSLSTAPGLPPAIHELLVDLQKTVVDLAALFNAYLSGDRTAYDSAQTSLIADDTALAAVQTDQVASDVAAFYKPYIDTYHSEITLAAG